MNDEGGMKHMITYNDRQPPCHTAWEREMNHLMVERIENHAPLLLKIALVVRVRPATGKDEKKEGIDR